MKRIGGLRRKTRSKYKKGYRQKGKFDITSFMQSFNVGDKVGLQVESAYGRGLYHPRFYGQIGKVIGKAGACYQVAIMDQHKAKTVIVHPVHLRKVL